MSIRHKLFILILTLGVASPMAFANVPVVFLHGWKGGASNWNNMTNLLVQYGGYDAKYLHPIDYWKTVDTSIQTYAVNVSDDIASWVSKLSKETGMSYQIDIVTHSMGGLVVRQMLADQNLIQGRFGIRKLITLATPHYGQNQELGTAAGQMKYGSSYLWDLAKAWEFENRRISSVLCVAGVYGSTLDDKLVNYWSAALSDCPVRYVNKVHASSMIGPTIYSCTDDSGFSNYRDPVYRLVVNYLLNGHILPQSECGTSISGRTNRGGAIYGQVADGRRSENA